MESLLARKGGAAELALAQRAPWTDPARRGRPSRRGERALQGRPGLAGRRGRPRARPGGAGPRAAGRARARRRAGAPGGAGRRAGALGRGRRGARGPAEDRRGRRDARRAPAPPRHPLPGAAGPAGARGGRLQRRAGLGATRPSRWTGSRPCTGPRRNWTGVVDCLQQLRAMETAPHRPGPHLAPARRGARRGLRRRRARGVRGAGGAARCCSRSPRRSTASSPSSSGGDGSRLLLQLLDERAAPPCPPAAAARDPGAPGRALPPRARRPLALRGRVPDRGGARPGQRRGPRRPGGHAEQGPGLGRPGGRGPPRGPGARPVRLASLETLYEIWDSQRLLDRTFCCAAVMAFLQAGPPRAIHLHLDWKGRLPSEAHARVDRTSLGAPAPPGRAESSRRGPPGRGRPGLEALPAGLRVARRWTRGRTGSGPTTPMVRAIRLVAEGFGVDHFEVYQAQRGLMVAETSDPPSICVGQDVVRRFNSREQKFLIGRAVFSLLERTALAGQAPGSRSWRTLLGDCIRVVVPDFEGLGQRDEGRVRTPAEAALAQGAAGAGGAGAGARPRTGARPRAGPCRGCSPPPTGPGCWSAATRRWP